MDLTAQAFTQHGETPLTRLGEWQEALGVLVGVDRDGGVIAFRSFKITVPPKELEHLQDLEAFIGKRVGILRTDLSHRPLLIRLAEESGVKEANK